MSTRQKLVLIDGHSILNRAFYGVPVLTNSKGMHTNAIHGFLNIMFKILEEEKPDFLAVAFDVHAPTFRHQMYESYKGTRKPMPEELREQVPVMKDVLRAMHITVMEKAGLEADDILGTLAKKAAKDGMEVALVSGDRDLLQVADETIKIRIPKTKQGKTEIEDYYPKDVLERYQIAPLQVIELKALMGDTADNIPGVPKIGEKTATQLIVEYGTLNGVYAHLDEIQKKSVRETLVDHRDLAELSRNLATIRTDSDVSLDYEASRADGFYTEEAYVLLKQLEMKKLLTRFEKVSVENMTQHAIPTEQFERIADLKRFKGRLDGIDAGKRVGLYLLQEQHKLHGVAVCDGGHTFYYELPVVDHIQLSLFETVQEDCTPQVREMLELFSQHHEIAAFQIKADYPWLDIDHTENYFDILIAAYLLNPLKSDYEIDTIAGEHLGCTVLSFHELVGKKKLYEVVRENPDGVMSYCCMAAYVIYAVKDVLEQKLEQKGMLALFREIEMPLSLVLYDMEQEGVLVKREELASYGASLMGRIEQLEQEIYKQAGEVFNINSPKQLGEILFDKLKLPGAKKTKTGYSTAAEILDKLAEDYPLVQNVLEYRGLAKLKSTYADGLASCIREDGRIHTSFNQTITATGRISSTEPNLQNIPMRMELGRQIRKVFVPRPGYVFMDADYSQIELRVLAHLSGDEQLIEAYHSAQDIHRITASKVFHTPFDKVTDLQRRNAKAVNFGIVYGISSFGLSQDLSISKAEAGEYINQYFETYPGVKKYLDKLVEDAKEKGFVTTMYGRVRPIPELSSSNFMQRSFGERVAMNSPIQGTAADIMKIAMIKVWKALRQENMASRLILQVHDELVIETAADEVERVREILTENMKHACELSVELEIDLHTGENWYEAK